jgi:surface glycoprotein (TIGR04207 family)/PGF-CTERM protein
MIRNEKTRALFLSVLMVLSVFGGAVAVTGTVGAADSGSDGDGLVVQSNHNTNANWSLDTPDIEVISGNLARFDVSFNDTNASTAYLVVGNLTNDTATNYGYEANITIEDDPDSASDSGTVVFNTYEAGGVTGNVPPVTATGGITVSVNESGNTAGVLQPTTNANGDQVREPYPVRFGTVSTDQAYTSPNTTGGLDIVSRSGVSPTIDTWTAPASNVSDLEAANATEIQELAADGVLTPGADAPAAQDNDSLEGVAKSDNLVGDWDALVYEIEAPGIEGFLETLGGPAPGMAAARALTLEQLDPFFNQPPKELDLSYNASGVSIKHEAGTDTYFAVLDVDELNLSRETNQGRIPFGSPQTGENYRVEFTVNDQAGTLSAVDDPTAFVNTTIDLDPANVNRNGEFETRPLETFNVSGTTALAPGTQLDIAIDNKPTSTSVFSFEGNATVDENGEFSVGYAPADVPASGSEFDLNITAPAHPAADGLQFDGLFRAQPTANVTFDDQTTPVGNLVEVASTDLSDGGFIAIHNVSGGTPGDIIGSSKLLAPGSHENVLVTLDEPISEDTTLVAMPHFDDPSDGFFNPGAGNDSFYYLTEPMPAGDLPTPENRTPVTDSAEITLSQGAGETPTPRVITETVIRNQTVIRTETVIRNRTVFRNVTDSQAQPGMGALVAVIALLAASLLAARRHDW